MNLYLLATVQLKHYEYIIYILISAHSPGLEKAGKGKQGKVQEEEESDGNMYQDILCPFYETSNCPS